MLFCARTARFHRSDQEQCGLNILQTSILLGELGGHFCAEKMEGDEDEASECFTKETNGLEGEGKGMKSNAV